MLSGQTIPPPEVGGEAEIVASIQVNSLTANRLVQSDGSKVLASVANLASWVAGTGSQVVVTDDGDGTVTLSLPQNIATTSSPTFASVTTTAQFLGAAGSAALASFSLTGATNTGVYFRSSATIAFTLAGTEQAEFNGGLSLPSTLTVSWTSGVLANAKDLTISRVSAGIGKVTNAALACEWRVHGDASKYAYISHGGTNATVSVNTGAMIVGTDGASSLLLATSGSARWDINSSGHFLAFLTNTYDIGAAAGATCPRTIYVGTSFIGPAGTAAAPTYTTSADTTTGINAALGNGYIVFSLAGTNKAAFFAGKFFMSSDMLLQWTAGAIDTGVAISLGRDADAVLALKNGVTAQTFRVYGTTTGPKYARVHHDTADAYFAASAGNCYLGTDAVASVGLMTGGVARWTVDGTLFGLTANTNYRFSHGTSALATNATEGFLFIQSCAGTPTGVPVSIPTGQKAICWDSTNKKLYVYDGAWMRAQVAAVDAIYA